MQRPDVDRVIDRIDSVENKVDDLALAQDGHFRLAASQVSHALEALEARSERMLRMWAIIHTILIVVLLVLPYVQHALGVR